MNNTKNKTTELRLPSWSKVLFEPQWRYISIRGGRGSGKTTNVAKALVIRSSQGKLRILCTREIQASIQESVYSAIVSEINKLGLNQFFEILSNEIRSIHGGKFIFRGLNDFSADGIKSLDDIDICWCEESQTLTEKSLRILSPSIRAKGSQIWFTWNSVLESDAIYKAVVEEGLPNCANLFINFDQNPFFPEILKLEEQHMLGNDPIMHRHVWLGHPLPAVEGAIYFNEMTQMRIENRIRNLAQDYGLKTYAVCDLGYNDYTSIGIVQTLSGEYRIIDFIENHRVGLSWFNDELRNRGYEDAILVMPHDARHKTLSADGKSMQQQMEAKGWIVEIVDNISVEDGIRLTREFLPKVYIDETKCKDLIEHMKQYKRSKTGHPVHDSHSHSCDMIRYVSIHAPKMNNSINGWGGEIKYKKLGY